MERYAYILRECAERANVLPVKQIATQPGIKAVYRVTLHHPDWRCADAVVTVTRDGEGVSREAVYAGCFNNQPITRPITIATYNAFVGLVGQAKFDKLGDQVDIPTLNADLCLFERAAGTFVKSVIFTPQKATGSYEFLLQAIQTYLPEALREIALK